MARFFFDSVKNGRSFSDDEGSELADAEAARLAALEFLPELLQHRPPLRDGSTYEVSVRNDAGRSIYRASLTISGGWITEELPTS